jgi:hypothetical protein
VSSIGYINTAGLWIDVTKPTTVRIAQVTANIMVRTSGHCGVKFLL